MGELSGEANVFTPTSLLLPGTSYVWRVDALASDGAVTTGDEWAFAAGCADVDCVDCAGSPYYAACVQCEDGYEVVGGRCSAVGGCLSGRWDINATATGYQVSGGNGSLNLSPATSSRPRPSPILPGGQLRRLGVLVL